MRIPLSLSNQRPKDGGLEDWSGMGLDWLQTSSAVGIPHQPSSGPDSDAL